MNKRLTLSLLLLLTGLVCEGNCAYNLDFASYIGGANSWDMLRDICVDNQGYIYIVGGTQSADFPTTPGAYDRTFATGGADRGSGGDCEVFVTKIDPNKGQIVWSTFLGGPNYDRAYAVEVDSAGYVYVAGRAGPGFPTTPNAFQPAFAGCRVGSKGLYGYQNAFVAKLKPDGSDLVWSSYVGIGEMCRDMAIDDNNDVYVPFVYRPISGWTPQDPAWFSSALQNAYQKTRRGGEECGAVKISSDGTQVIWATWLGGSGDDSGASSIRVDNSNNVYLGLTTFSDDIPTTIGPPRKGAGDFYVAKLTPDGSNLLYGTYIGSSGDDWISTHNLAVDGYGNAYVAVPTKSDFPVTSGVFDEQYNGGNVDWGVGKFSPDGTLLASTFVGGNGLENPDGIYVDSVGNVFISGETDSTNFPVTANAHQSSNAGGKDAVLVMLSADFSTLLYCTYIGGSNNDAGRNGYLGSDGCLYVGGTSNGPGWPTVNAFQDTYKGGGDGIVAKFTPLELANQAPIAVFTAIPTSGNVPLTVKFDASGSSDPDGTIVSFIWREGGTQIATGANPTVTLSVGTHNITLTVTDNGGLTDTDTVTIKVVKEDEEFGELPTGCYNNVIDPLKGEKTIIVVETEKQGYIRIDLYDTKGNKIKELADEEKDPGRIYRYYWDGKDDSGNVVGSGLYFAHIAAGDYKETKKIVVVK